MGLVTVILWGLLAHLWDGMSDQTSPILKKSIEKLEYSVVSSYLNGEIIVFNVET